MIQNGGLASINKKAPEGLKKGGEPYKVLVVDDSAVMRKMIVQILKSEAYNICGEAANGTEAVDKYKELSPDVVTLDINMPDKDGLTALKEILFYDKKAKVIMLTSESQKETVLEAVSCGAKNYIVKPPERIMVLKRLNEALN